MSKVSILANLCLDEINLILFYSCPSEVLSLRLSSKKMYNAIQNDDQFAHHYLQTYFRFTKIIGKCHDLCIEHAKNDQKLGLRKVSHLCNIGLALEKVREKTLENYSKWSLYADAYTLNHDVFVHSVESENGKSKKNFTIFTDYGYPLRIEFKDEIDQDTYYGFTDSYFSISVNGNQFFRVLIEHHSEKASVSYRFADFLSIIPYIFLDVEFVLGLEDPEIQFTIEALLVEMICSICGVTLNAPYITNEVLTLSNYKRFSRVCFAFVEILSFDKRYLFFKKLAIDYPNLFDKRVAAKECHSVAGLISDRLIGSSLCVDMMINEYMLLIFKKGLYICGMFIYIEDCDYLSGELFLRMLVNDFVEKGLQDLNNIPKRLLNDKEFIMNAMRMSKRSPYCYTHISERLKVDPDIVLTAVRKCPQVALKIPFERLDLETKKKVCSIVLKPPKSALFDNYYRHYPRNPLAWIPTAHSCYERAELLDYFVRKKPNLMGYHTLVTGHHLEMECIQLMFFKRKDYYGAFSLMSGLVISENIDYDLLSIFERDDYPELFTKQIEKFPFIGKGTFTLNDLVPVCLSSDSFYMDTILDQPYTPKHFNFFRNHLKKRGVYPGLAKKIMDGSIREKAIDPSQADAFLSEVLSNKKIVKKLLAIQPSYFPFLSDDMKKEKDLIDIALRYPNNLEVLGKTDENYLKILDKCFTEAKIYIAKQVGSENLKNFLNRLYFNVNEDGTLINLKDSVMYEFPKIIVPITKYFNNHYPIEHFITRDQILDIVKLGDPTTLERMARTNLPYVSDPDVRKALLLKVSHFCFDTEEIDDELCYEVMLKNPKLLVSSPIYYFVGFLAKHDYYFGKLLLAKRPKLIERLYGASRFFSKENCVRLVNDVPEISPYLENIKNQPVRYY
ncbi:Hypothetical protein NAEGRDRAFT_71862 [Naegleria gruberi]|uniref:DUF4116 domain-containing protein n=1 Tax=Naegleria gruberi TaxID=5762 RepID=D2VS96_NAEGR|nr:uncharacterized protein NAEGRDRAFT_71862 [Naegleria gruberi]EFC40386.1 Hypothetical protein NAEGRDRAFT_71862 [Naegleria gruberi]|eukprot:XP_002673130.1 Hypothetical protein NAEGRDRAFT_71862 [Naegleria gruberi strain NEG-M]